MSRRPSLLLAFILLVFAPQISFAQVDPNRLIEIRERIDRDSRWIELREKGALIYQKSVQEELKLTEEQLVELRRVFGKIRPNELQFKQLLQSATPEDASALNKKIKDYFEDVDSTVAGVLDAAQSQRLREIHLQSLGVTAITRPAYSESLELSRQQRSQAGRLGLDLMRLEMPMRPGMGEDQKNTNQEAKKKINEQFLGLLNEEQKGKWEKLLGKPFEFRPEEVRDSRAAVSVGDRSARSNLPTGSPDLSIHVKMNLLGKEAVLAELQLMAAQIAIVNEARSEVQKLNEEARKTAAQRANQTASERASYREESAKRLAKIEKASNRAISENLTAVQLRRLHELYLQYRGIEILEQPDISEAIGLEDWQRTDVRTINRQFMTEQLAAMRSKPPEEDGLSFAKKFLLTEAPRRDAKLLELLTKEQRSKWDQLLGKPFPIEQLKGSDAANATDQSPPK